ncbi:transglutaminase [Actinomadura craniellae]|uniref:Transglutaminase n=1 Tax=Actinomadura craniellae TaxID=2231787 RepID=A0A365HBR2_9ACTN|nr:DUF3488 and transglutaminase-like domain-containing protein [Actinomadura craniellae]RAY16537.1 transglutaminase [Actinomadura craniellae]
MRVKLACVAAAATLLCSVGLYPLFEGQGWFWSGLGAVVTVAATGLVTRRFRLPAAFDLLAGLAALHLYLTARFAAGEAFLGVVPTPSSLYALAELVETGWAEANKYAAPVPLVPGLSLLVTAGVGAVALMVDLLAVRLRRAAPAGLPLLAMYSVPAAVREESLGWPAFALGAGGFLALLLADSREQVGGWGRPVPSRFRMGATTGERLDSSALAVTGRRLGGVAIVVAVLVPMIVPGIQRDGMFGLGGDDGGGGAQTVTTPDPLVSLKRELVEQDDAVVLTYRTDDPEVAAGGRPEYLRLYALDRFDGDRWTYSELRSSATDRVRDRPLPPAPGLTSVGFRRVRTSIGIEDRVRNMTFLPVPYAPTSVDIRGDWRADAASLMVYSLRHSAGGRNYRVESTRAMPTAQQLAVGEPAPMEISRRYTRVPPNIPEAVRREARSIVGDATSAYEQAVRLQTWFTRTGGFVYDLNAPPPKHGADLVDFLLESKRGYCEQFAASMALLARILNIPARVALGYTPGTQGSDGIWTVRSRDAHAWPELYFQGAGWVRFEPTPSGVAGQGSASPPAYSEPAPAEGEPAPGDTAVPTPAATDGAQPSTAPNDPRQNRPDDPGAAGDLGSGADSGLPVAPLLAGLLVLALLITPMAGRAVTRRRRWAVRSPSPTEGAHAAWAELRADAVDHGLIWRASESPRATARRLTGQLALEPEAAEAMGRLALAEERARYAPTPAAADTLRADVATVRAAFASSVGRATRWRARLLPPSTVTALRSSAGRLLVVLDRLDATRLDRDALLRVLRRRR